MKHQLLQTEKKRVRGDVHVHVHVHGYVHVHGHVNVDVHVYVHACIVLCSLFNVTISQKAISLFPHAPKFTLSFLSARFVGFWKIMVHNSHFDFFLIFFTFLCSKSFYQKFFIFFNLKVFLKICKILLK